MVIVEHRTTILPAPILIHNSDVAICEKIKETYLSGDRILAAAVDSSWDPIYLAQLVRCLMLVKTHWTFPTLLQMLNVEELQDARIVICTVSSNYEIYRGRVRSTVTHPLIVGKSSTLRFLYSTLGLSAERSVAIATLLSQAKWPIATSKIFLTKGYIYPDTTIHRYGIIQSIATIVGGIINRYIFRKI